MRIHVLADDEERRRGVARGERVEDHRSPAAVRTVVERQRDLVLTLPIPIHDVWRGEHHDGILVDHAASRIGRHDAMAGRGPLADAKDVAATIGRHAGRAHANAADDGRRLAPRAADHVVHELHVVAWRHDPQAIRTAIEAGAAQYRPEGGVLLTQAPDGGAGHSQLLSDAELVVRGRAVEIPHDVVDGVRVGPREVRIEGDGIEARGDAVVSRRLHGLLKRHGFGRAAVVVPIVSVGAHHQNDLLRGDGGHDLAGPIPVKLMAGDRSRCAASVMLVEEHGEDVVVHRGDAHQVARRGVGRHRLGHDTLEWRERVAERHGELQRRFL